MTDPWEVLVRETRRFFEDGPQGPVLPIPGAADADAEHVASYDFREPVPLETAVTDVAGWLRRGIVHTTHPRYFGLFNPSVHLASIAADTLAAVFNPQLAVVSHSPAADRMERSTLAYLTRKLGWDPATTTAHFTSGGSEANLTATGCALTHVFPDFTEGGLRGLPGDPVLYVSEETHHSFEKNARILGLGRQALATVAVDADRRMDPVALRAAIRRDRAAGRCPFLVVGTAGTTTLGVIDPLTELSAVCREEGLWFHADAAWGGGAVLSPKLRHHLAGIELADSVTWDAHKWLSVSMGAGMFFSRHPRAVADTFGVQAPYVLDSIGARGDAFVNTMLWSRRFIGLKVFLTLAELGEKGMAAHIERQAALGELLRSKLRHAGWVVPHATPFPLVCFTHDDIRGGRVSTGEILCRVEERGQAWISEAALGGEPVLRACITSYRTREVDLDILLDELERARGATP